MGVSLGLEEKVDNIASTLRVMLSGRQMATICGICCTEGHPNDLCPYVQGIGPEEVNGVWKSTPNNTKWDPYSKTHNEGWKAHPNFRWGNSQASPSSGPPIASLKIEQKNKQNFKNLENQVGQPATAVNHLEAKQSGALPSQTVPNRRENVSVVSLRNGRQLEEVGKVKRKEKQPMIREEEEEIVIEEGEKDSIVEEKESIPSSIPVVEQDVPFPDALKRTHHFEHDKDIYEVFQKNKKLKGMKKVKGKGLKGKISEYVSALFQKKLPPKCGDPGIFAIPCTIGDLRFEKAMLDLGASINVIPYAIYETLKLGPLKDISVIVQLADRSSVYPKGIVENVMVGLGAIPVLLGRSFLRTAGTKIDVPKGSLTMEFDGTVVKFEINKPSSRSPIIHSVCIIETSSNHVLSKCREPPLPSNVSNVLQRSSPKEQKYVILWDRREDVEASRGKKKAWFDKLIHQKGS
ncbi:uncharacterized protein LOC141607881 [Silene latifolia]|uniref:uncharacterized protein LOC141607881 n=1 Tax=Silene latifolia TaxID=37657 RepID=UPI003D78349F